MKKLVSLVSGLFTGGASWLPMAGVVAAAVAALVLWAYVTHLQDDRDRWRVNATVAIDAAKQNEQAALATMEHATSMVDAMVAERDAYAMRVQRLTEIRRGIDHAPQSDDGPVAPVLGRVLDGLRHAAGGAGGEGEKTPGAGGAVNVFTNAGAAQP